MRWTYGATAVAWALVGGLVAAPAWGADGIDRGYIPADAFVAAVAHPQRVLQSPEMEFLPVEVLTAAGMKEAGFDPAQIEEALLVFGAPRGEKEPLFGVVVRFATPLPEKVLPMLLKKTVQGQLNGKPYHQSTLPNDPSLVRLDDRTFLLGHDEMLRKMVASQAKPEIGAVRKSLDRIEGSPDVAVVTAVDPIRPMITQGLRQAHLPPILFGLQRSPELVTSIEATANLTGDQKLSLVLRARDEAAAKQLEALLNGALDVGKMLALEATSLQLDKDDSVGRAQAQYLRRVSGRIVEMLRPTRKGDCLALGEKLKGGAQMQIASTGILVGLLLPAVQSAREAGRRAQSANNLKQIGLAMLNYESSHNKFPPQASVDKNGKPLLSWRVHILPYIEEDTLYKQFHLDEPWDSEHNRKLIPLMPRIYQNPSAPLQPGMASYLAVCGKGMMFDGAEKRKIADVRDGTSNTIMVVEADPDRAVVWTKPGDLQVDPKQPLAGLGKAHPGGFTALFCDCSVRFMSESIAPELFYKLLTIAGEEPVNANGF